LVIKASGYAGDDPQLILVSQLSFQTLQVANVLIIEEQVDIGSQAALVGEQVGVQGRVSGDQFLDGTSYVYGLDINTAGAFSI
jgi:stress response protein YsnF